MKKLIAYGLYVLSASILVALTLLDVFEWPISVGIALGVIFWASDIGHLIDHQQLRWRYGKDPDGWMKFSLMLHGALWGMLALIALYILGTPTGSRLDDTWAGCFIGVILGGMIGTIGLMYSMAVVTLCFFSWRY